MYPNTPAINTTACRIKRIRYSHLRARCEPCGHPAPRAWETSRTAIDVDLDGPVFLLVTVGVYHCRRCGRYFRSQPPFLRPNAIYTERVRQKAILSVYEDGMAFRRVTERLARDFWVSPSEAMIRRWCREYAEELDFCGDYQSWVVEEFSGILCVDEVYQDQMALFVAVDPAAPDGDRLLGYQLTHGAVQPSDVEGFLAHLKELGIEPEEIITDGFSLYPKAISEVWPEAARQLCLFHETRAVTKAAQQVFFEALRQVPKVRFSPGTEKRHLLKGLPGKYPSSEKLAAHQAAICRVFALREQGMTIMGIARQTGHSRHTVRKWLRGKAPKRVVEAEFSEEALLLSLSPEELSEKLVVEDIPAPPDPWSSWYEVKRVREVLSESRYLLIRRPEHLDQEETDKLEVLFESPIGGPLRLVRAFLEDWYAIWRDKAGARRTLDEAHQRYDLWRSEVAYGELKPLARVQARFDAERFGKVFRFLEYEQWEATSNGAERTARAFRHLQGPHYNLRKPQTVGRAIESRACLFKQRKLREDHSPPPGRCTRGRKARRRFEELAAA